MRQHKAGMLAAKLTPKQKIKIECARPPTLLKRTIAPELSFQTLEMIKQLQGRHQGIRAINIRNEHYSIPVIWLYLSSTNRSCFDAG